MRDLRLDARLVESDVTVERLDVVAPASSPLCLGIGRATRADGPT